MTCWLIYRRGSFCLKENHLSEISAVARVTELSRDGTSSWIKIVPPDYPTLLFALELRAAT